MDRPHITQFIPNEKDWREVHEIYVNSKPLYDYAVQLDLYIDYLEEKLKENYSNETTER